MREGSNSYALAKRFCSCHELNAQHVEPLAEMVKGQVAAYCAAIERRKERALRAENRRKLLRWQKRFTTSVTHDVHAGLRVTKRAATRRAARAHDLSASSTPAEGQVVGRLHIEIGGGQTGTLVVHTGCDARQLAYGFCAAHALADDAAAQIEQQIERHLLEASVRRRSLFFLFTRCCVAASTRRPTGARLRAAAAAARSRYSATSVFFAPPRAHPTYPAFRSQEIEARDAARQTQREDAATRVRRQQREANAPLFNLEVRLAEGRAGVVPVFAGCDSAALARTFVEEHALPAKAIQKLTRLIDDNVAIYAAGQSEAPAPAHQHA